MKTVNVSTRYPSTNAECSIFSLNHLCAFGSQFRNTAKATKIRLLIPQHVK